MKKGLSLSVTVSMMAMSLAAVVPAMATTIVDGDLVKAADSSALYLISGSSKRVFPHASVYHSWGYPSNYSTVKTVTSAELASYADGTAIPFRDGSLFRGVTSSLHGKDASCVFVVADGQLRPILSAAVYQALYSDPNWTLVKWIPNNMLSKFNYPIGSMVSDSTTHPNGTVVKYAASSALYLISGGQKRAFTSWSAYTGNRYGKANIVTIAATETYADGANITGAESALVTPGAGPTVGVGTGLTVATAADSPAATTIVADTTSGDGAQALIPFLKANFTASSDGAVQVNTVKVTRSGISADADLSNVYLYDGDTRIAENPSISSGGITFTNSTGLFTVGAGTTKAITVKADLANGTTSGKTIALGIASSADVTTDGAAVNGSAQGNIMSTATVSNLGKLTVADVSSSTTVDPGTTNHEAWKFSLQAADQNVEVKKIALTMVGTISTSDLSNLKLYDGATQIGSTLANLDASNRAEFDLTASPGLAINAGVTKNISLKVDVAGGASRNFRFSIQKMSDVVVKDTNYNVYLKPNQADAWAIIQAANVTAVNQGSMSVTLSSASPSGNVALNATGVEIARYELKAVGEAIKITTLTYQVNLTGATDLNNVKLLVDGSQVGTTQNPATGGTAYAVNVNFTVNAGSTRILTAKADIQGTGVGNGDAIQFRLNTGAANAQRQSSMTTLNVPGANMLANSLTVSAATLATVKNPSVANMTVVNGSQGVVIGSWLMQAGASEGVDVNSISIIDRNAGDTANGAQGIGSAFDVLELWSGGTKYGQTINSPSATAGTTQTFSLSTPLTINAGQSVQVDLKANVLSGAVWTATNAIKISTASGIGKTTNNTVTDATGANGQQITTANAGTLTVTIDSGTPDSAQMVMANTAQTMGIWKFAANNTENLTVTQIIVHEIHADNTPGNVKNLQLTWSGGSSSVIPALTAGVPNQAVFSGLNIPVPKGGDIKVTLKADITDSANATSVKKVQFRIAVPATITGVSTDTIIAKGASSNNYAATPGASNQDANAMIVYKTKPTISLHASSPSGNLIPGTVEVLRFTISANAGGDVSLTAANANNIRFTITSNKSALVTARVLDLYDASTSTTVATQVTAIPNSGVTVDFAAGLNTTIAAGTSKTYYVKANLQDFTTQGDSFQLSIQNAAADLSWSDGTANGADISDTMTKNLPMSGNTLVKP
ncbi:MAG: hypothetical protein AB1414_06075 [bacterium]